MTYVQDGSLVITRPGDEYKLNYLQLDGLRQDLIDGPTKCGFEFGIWTLPLVIAHVRNKYNIEYKNGGMPCLLHRMKLPC